MPNTKRFRIKNQKRFSKPTNVGSSLAKFNALMKNTITYSVTMDPQSPEKPPKIEIVEQPQTELPQTQPIPIPKPQKVKRVPKPKLSAATSSTPVAVIQLAEMLEKF